MEEPPTLSKALVSPDHKEWYPAWESEVDSLVSNDMWELVTLPAGCNPIGCRWLFRSKNVGPYGAKLVAKGYSQQEGLDYTETFTAVAKFSSLHTLSALVSENDWELEGIDVKTAFLYGELEDTVYIDIPEGLGTDVDPQANGTPIFCCLVRAIYGLKQSRWAWFGKIN